MKNLFFTIIIFACSLSFAKAQYGILDTAFGVKGKAQFGLYVSTGYEEASDIAFQSDGKILIVGYSSILNALVIARLNYDGSIDASFGGNGFASVPNYYGGSIALQSTGKIVVCGDSLIQNNSQCCVFRFNSDGTPDLAFGNQGRTNLINLYDQTRLTLQADDKILVTGDFAELHDFGIARLTANGALDFTFGASGYPGHAKIDMGAYDKPRAICFDKATGKILVAGYTYNNIVQRSAVLRLNPNGTPDSLFGTNGKVVTGIARNIPAGQGDVVNKVQVVAGGKVLIGGYFGDDASADTTFCTRLNSNGSVDVSFGIYGTLRPLFYSSAGGLEQAYSFVVQPDEKIIIGGSSFDNSTVSTVSYDFCVARYNADGTPDNTFKKGVYDFYHSADHAYALSIEPDGKLVMAGFSWLSGDGPMAALRFTTGLTSNGIAETNPLNLIKLFPNPSGNHITLDINMDEEGNLSAEVYAVDGRWIKNLFTDKRLASRDYHDFDISDLTQGQYMLALRSRNKLRSIPFQKF